MILSCKKWTILKGADMINKMIPADLLLQWFSNQTYISFIDDIAVRFVDIKYGDIINKINELATPAPEPQESIFDADGWNNNFAEAPQGYDTPILIKYYCDWNKAEGVTVGHYEEPVADYGKEGGFYTWYETGCIGETDKVKNLIAWRLLPTGSKE